MAAPVGLYRPVFNAVPCDELDVRTFTYRWSSLSAVAGSGGSKAVGLWVPEDWSDYHVMEELIESYIQFKTKTPRHGHGVGDLDNDDEYEVTDNPRETGLL
jgi:predicted hydrocarbon binding protein